MRIKIIVALSLIGSFPISALSQSVDRAALEALYHATDGPNWTDSDGWLTESPIGEWNGVTVHDERVIELRLIDNGLAGPLPSEIAFLDMLNVLDLRWNSLTGVIPDMFSSLPYLRVLYLSSNDFTGEIPRSVASLSRLEQLDLSYNGLTGSIPNELGFLSSLRGLGLHHNQLEGEIPLSLGNASRLERVIIDHNDLVGDAPDRWHSIELLSVDENPGLVERETPVELSGLDALNETTYVIGDDRSGFLIEQLMRSIRVRDGHLWIDENAIPAGIDAAEVVELIDEINGRMGELGDRIESADDMNRLMEKYGRGRIEIPVDDSDDFEFDDTFDGFGAAAAPSVPTPNEPAHENILLMPGDSLSNYLPDGAVAQQFVLAVIDCTALNAISPYVRYGNVEGAAHGSCQVVSGSPTNVRYRLHVKLYKIEVVGISLRYVWQATRTYRRTGYNPFWNRNFTYVDKRPCSAGTWQTRLSLYATSNEGRFRPYPARSNSPGTTITCGF